LLLRAAFANPIFLIVLPQEEESEHHPALSLKDSNKKKTILSSRKSPPSYLHIYLTVFRLPSCHFLGLFFQAFRLVYALSFSAYLATELKSLADYAKSR